MFSNFYCQISTIMKMIKIDIMLTTHTHTQLATKKKLFFISK